jgi:hypothetical protein
MRRRRLPEEIAPVDQRGLSLFMLRRLGTVSRAANMQAN